MMLAEMPVIPAMTTDAERELYYRLVKAHAHEGAVIELGAWLGASTAYIAAAMRDAGAGKAHVYDRFMSKAGHAEKVRAFYANRSLAHIPQGPCLEQFTENLGPMIDHVIVHKGEIEDLTWGFDKIAVLITDAPKRVPAISTVLTKLRHGLQPGSIMAWQDFCHFPSYEIPACLYRLREHIEFVEAVVPGTTLAFRVTSQWDADEVTEGALSLKGWAPQEISEAWRYWSGYVPPEKSALFRCGMAMFLCDTGFSASAVNALLTEFLDSPEAILPKWQYLARTRPDFVMRYAPLFGFLRDRGAL